MRKLLILSSLIWGGAVFANTPAPVVDLSGTDAGASVPPVAEQQPVAVASVAVNNQVNAYPATATAPAMDTSSMSMEQRIARLEQQVNNLTQMNFSGRSDELQQSVQQLSGQMEVFTHDLQQLKEQQQNFYQDLDKRIAALKVPATEPKTADAATSDAAKLATAEKKTTPAGSPTSQSKEDKLYQDAFTSLVNKQNSKAITGFKAYLTQFPTGKYVANAHYWLGELYMNTKQLDQAETQFKTIVSDYSSSSKLSDAKLKIALIHDQNGLTDQAKKELQAIVKQYPGTSAAKLANLRLQQLKAAT